MAVSKCGACESTMFELKETEPYRSSVKMFFVQCRMCGTVVGVTEYYNAGSLAKKALEVANRIARKLGVSPVT